MQPTAGTQGHARHTTGASGDYTHMGHSTNQAMRLRINTFMVTPDLKFNVVNTEEN